MLSIFRNLRYVILYTDNIYTVVIIACPISNNARYLQGNNCKFILQMCPWISALVQHFEYVDQYNTPLPFPIYKHLSFICIRNAVGQADRVCEGSRLLLQCGLIFIPLFNLKNILAREQISYGQQ